MNALPYILVSGVFAVLGQVLLKRGLVGLGVLDLSIAQLPHLVLTLALTPLVVLGLLVTVTGTFFWLITLSRVELSFAYPFASLNYLAILAGSWWMLGESLSEMRMLGVLAICAGVLLIARSQTPSRQTHDAAVDVDRVRSGSLTVGQTS